MFAVLPTIIAIAVFFTIGCAKEPSWDKDIAAYVNKDVIYKSDLKRDIALRAKYDPAFKLTPETESEQLDAMITRKIMVQYAMEKGLAREERFVAAIRSIWEHTLIRDFIEYQKKEFLDYLFATREDIENYYNNMSYKVTFNVFKSRSRGAADAAYNRYIIDKDASGWQVVGPIAYDEIEPVTLLDAFKMGEGETGRFTDDSNYYVIAVSKKEKLAEAEPLEALKADIEKRVIAMKEKRLFEDWLKERRKHSKIKINAGTL
jgi:hypothetical protein